MSRFPSRITITLTLLLATLGWAAGPVQQAYAATATVACSQTAVQAALDAGGSYAFAGDCTLVITATLSAGNTTTPTTLDGNGYAVVFDGNNATQILSVNGGVALTLVDLTLRHGNAGDGFGGAIHNSGALTVTASTLSFNTGTYGGAVRNEFGGTVTISASTLASNFARGGSAGWGGAVYNDTFGGVFINASTLALNVATYGGAVANTSHALCTIGDNTFNTLESGRLLCAAAVIFASTLVSNTAASDGGAVFDNAPAITTGSCSADSNLCVTTVAINASSLVSNTAFTSGGGGAVAGTGDAIGDTLLAGNDCLGSLPSFGHNLTYKAPGCPTGGTGDVSGLDPLLGPLANNGGPTKTLAVGPGSPAIGAGDPALCGPGATDQRGVARTPATCTIGAYEYQDVGGATQSQTITFDLSTLPAKTYGDSPFDVSSYGSASSGLTVSFGSATTGVCTVSGSTVTIVSAGTCTIDADQAGNGTYVAALQVQQSFTVATATPIITWGKPAAITYGTPLSTTQLDATASVAGSFTYTPASGTVLNAGSGQTLSASFTPTDATKYSTANGTATIDVAQASQAIGFGALSAQLSNAAPFAVSATGGASGNPVTFAASPSTVCTAGGANGSTMTIVGVGTCTVTASQAGSTNYFAAPDVQQTFGVTAPQQAPATISLSNLNQTYDGSARYATATTTPSGLSGVTITYAQGTTAVSAPTNAGSYSVDASLNNANYTASDATGTLVIARASQTTTFDLSTLPAKTYGDAAFSISSYASATSGLAVTFSATTGVCTVAGSTVTIVSAGTCTIDADQAGNANYDNAPQVQQSFTVAKAAPTVTLSSSASPSIVGQAITFSATVSAVAGSPTGTVQFKIDGSDFGLPVSLSGGKATSGSVSSVAVGAHAISAAYLGDANFSSATGTLTQNVTYRIKALYNQTSKNNSGSSIPIKVQIQSWAGANLSASGIAITLASPALSPSPAPAAPPTGTFTFMTALTGNFYQYNLKTTGYPKATYTLSFSVAGDPVKHSVQFVIG